MFVVLEILSSSFYWICSTDIAVGLLVWCLKDNRMNRLTVKGWQSLRRFSRWTLVWDPFGNNCHTEVGENPKENLVVNVMRQTDWQLVWSTGNTFLIERGTKQSCTNVTGSCEWWRSEVQFIVTDNIKIYWLTVKTVRSARSQFTFCRFTTPKWKRSMKVACDKLENQFMLQDGEIYHRQHAGIHYSL